MVRITRPRTSSATAAPSTVLASTLASAREVAEHAGRDADARRGERGAEEQRGVAVVPTARGPRRTHRSSAGTTPTHRHRHRRPADGARGRPRSISMPTWRSSRITPISPRTSKGAGSCRPDRAPRARSRRPARISPTTGGNPMRSATSAASFGEDEDDEDVEEDSVGLTDHSPVVRSSAVRRLGSTACIRYPGTGRCAPRARARRCGAGGGPCARRGRSGSAARRATPAGAGRRGRPRRRNARAAPRRASARPARAGPTGRGTRAGRPAIEERALRTGPGDEGAEPRPHVAVVGGEPDPVLERVGRSPGADRPARRAAGGRAAVSSSRTTVGFLGPAQEDDIHAGTVRTLRYADVSAK